MSTFTDEFNKVMEGVHLTALDKGWWEEKCNDGEKIALMHSELSEALEAFREGNPLSTKFPQFTEAELELADVVIRIMDFAGHYGFRIAEALEAKAEYNKTRPHRHGGKAF